MSTSGCPLGLGSRSDHSGVVARVIEQQSMEDRATCDDKVRHVKAGE